MSHRSLARLTPIATLLAGMAALAGCAHQRVAMVAAPPAVALVDAPALPPAVRGPSPINAGLSPSATVWHLRAALNVAALACRAPAEAGMAAQYNQLIAAQKMPFAVAQAGLSGEFRAGGGAWQDRMDEAMTRLYNFFSSAHAHARFCHAALAVMADASGQTPASLAAFAAERLPRLDAAITDADPAPASAIVPLDPPVIALAAAPAPARPIARPRLELDLSSLPAD